MLISNSLLIGIIVLSKKNEKSAGRFILEEIVYPLVIAAPIGITFGLGTKALLAKSETVDLSQTVHELAAMLPAQISNTAQPKIQIILENADKISETNDDNIDLFSILIGLVSGVAAAAWVHIAKTYIELSEITKNHKDLSDFIKNSHKREQLIRTSMDGDISSGVLAYEPYSSNIGKIDPPKTCAGPWKLNISVLVYDRFQDLIFSPIYINHFFHLAGAAADLNRIVVVPDNIRFFEPIVTFLRMSAGINIKNYIFYQSNLNKVSDILNKSGIDGINIANYLGGQVEFSVNCEKMTDFDTDNDHEFRIRYQELTKIYNIINKHSDDSSAEEKMLFRKLYCVLNAAMISTKLVGKDVEIVDTEIKRALNADSDLWGQKIEKRIVTW